jgi:hypothetical protein
MTFDGKAFGKDIVEATKAHIDKTVAPLLAEIAALKAEVETLKAAPVPKDGQSITVEDVAPMIKAEIDKLAGDVCRTIPEAVQAAVAALPAAKDGQDADPEAVAAIIAENIRKDFDDLRATVKALPAPVELPDIPAMITEAITGLPNELGIKAMISEAIAAIPPAENGKDADPDLMASLAAEAAERAVAALPVPKDGQSVTLDDVRPLIDEAVTKAVTSFPLPKDGVDGKDGRDGVDVKDLLVVEGGDLVATFTDGRTKVLGPFRGKDGAPGAPGKDGADGFAFEDMTEELADDGRTIIRRYTRGDQVKEFRHTLSVVLDRGVYKEGQTYQAGDGVTWSGSFWIAQEETTEKPDTGKGFRLAVKRGRDGKDGIVRTVNDKPIVKAGA